MRSRSGRILAFFVLVALLATATLRLLSGVPPIARSVEPRATSVDRSGERTADEPACIERSTPDSPRVAAEELPATLRGRVIDSHGRPATCRIHYKRAGEEGLGSSSGAKRDGCFEIEVKRSGLYDLVAESDELGTAALRGVPIVAGEPVEPVTLELHGPGIVRGVVQDARGVPSPALELQVLLAAVDGPGGRSPAAGSDDVRYASGGRYWAITETADDGSFEVRGLRDDRYVIRARTGRERDGFPLLLTPAPVESDGSPLVVTFDRPHLLVRLLDVDRRSWLGESVLERGGPFRDCSEAWPEKMEIVVAPLPQDWIRECAPGSNPPGKRLGDDYLFEVESSRRYLVGLLGGGQPWMPVEVDVEEGASRVEVTVTVREPTQDGELSVYVSDGEGKELENDFVVQIEHFAHGIPLIRSGDYGRSSPKRFRLPAGEYCVVVEGEHCVDSHHRTLRDPRHYGRFATQVQITAESETRIDATLPAGARIHLRLEGELREEDREALRAAYPDVHFGEPFDDVAKSASLGLLAASRWAEAVYFTRTLDFDAVWGGNTVLRSSLPLGSDEISQILPAGSYTLEARLPGGRVASAPVVLVDGETTDVTFRFD